MKQVMNYHKDNGLLNMIRRTDPMITAPFTDVYVNNYANGLYIVTVIYNGNTYHAKVYINH